MELYASRPGPRGRKPVEEFDGCERIGAPRVRVPDLRREEFKKAIGGALAGGCDKGRCTGR